jgi:hypothetical protein
MEARMSGTPDWRWDDIPRGRDPDSLYWERVREEEFQRPQRKSEQELDRRRLDIRRDYSLQDTADASPAPRPLSPREAILQCRRDILDRLNCCVWLEAHLKEDWASRLANLTDADWHNELGELRQDVVREAEDWRRTNANNLWRREQYGDFLRDLGTSLECLELKRRKLVDGK